MMEETLQITTNRFKRCELVTAIGRIDSYTAPSLEETLKSITDAGGYKIVLDMSAVNFVSSKGWWVMIEAQKRCKRYNRGELVLAGIDERISSSLELIGLGSYFQVFDDVTTAVGSF